MNIMFIVFIAAILSGCAPLVIGAALGGGYEIGKHHHHDNGKHEGWH